MTLRIKPRAFASQTVRGFSYSLFLGFPSILPFPRNKRSLTVRGSVMGGCQRARSFDSRAIKSREKRGFARHFLFRTTFGVRHSFTPLSAVNIFLRYLSPFSFQKEIVIKDRGHLTAALSSKAWSLTVLCGCAPSPFSARVNFFYAGRSSASSEARNASVDPQAGVSCRGIGVGCLRRLFFSVTRSLILSNSTSLPKRAQNHSSP